MDHATRIRHVTAVLGPTNTGKTHLAIERMLDHETGMIGLPLRLLAREVYDKVAARAGTANVALITGEEKIKPESARYWICTVEAMPRDIAVDFMAIDEIQLASDPERGHVFTDRLLQMRGQLETLVLGAATMREVILDIIPGANFISRPRLSKLTYTGQKKITRLPTRSAIVAFSASDVYSIAELIRRQRGGAAVVLGALSPRTRNAQVALYQSGDVDFLVATDAVGMGLNLDVDHVAFSAIRKFDGHTHRNLTPSELGQIAGRAGRHLNDGTFGVTGDVEPFEADLVERLESHTFDPVKFLQWRSSKLDFGSLDRLRDSLRQLPDSPRLVRARMAEDVEALENVSNDRDVVTAASSPSSVAKLWEVCQIPDYRKISSQSHAELVAKVYGDLMSSQGRIDEEWFAKQVAYSDKTDGDIDTLSNRLAHIRTWTFVANREDWLRDPAHWQGRTREIEDNLSDALHERLTQRFVDARTSALMKGLNASDELTADIGEDGSVNVENHYVGQLVGFRFSQAADAEGIHQKAARQAAVQVLSKELAMRVRRVVAAKDDAFKLDLSGKILWRDEQIGQLEPGDAPLKPTVSVLCDEHLQPFDRDRIRERLETWINGLIAEKLKPLVAMSSAEDISGLAKGIAFQLSENLGVLRREAAAADIKSLDQAARAQLRRHGLRFGAFNLFFPMLLKPAPAELLLTLWCLKYAEKNGLKRQTLPEAPRAGLTSVAADPTIPEPFYQAYGFHVCGPRAVRIDILERLADLIRPLISWRASEDKPLPPKGATGDGGFTVTAEMMSILGCSPEELGSVLQALGFRLERKPAPVAAPVVTETKAGGVTATGDEVAADASVASPNDATAVVEAGADTDGPGAAVGSGSETDAPQGIAETAQSEVPPPIQVVSADSEAVPGDTAAMSDAVAGEQGSEPEKAAAPEPEMIEIWRPRRRNEGPPRQRGNRMRRQDEDRPAVQQEGQGEGKRSETRRNDGGRRPPQGERSERPAHQARADRTGGEGKGRGDRRKGGGGRRHEEHRGAPRPRVHSSAPSRNKGIDPDSPFAALSALKQSFDKPDKGS